MKTEMISLTNSTIIGGNLVQIDNKHRYHVTDKNGKQKILTKDQFDKNIIENQEKLANGEDFKFKKPMTATQKTLLTLGTIGAAVAAIVYRKNITNFFKNIDVKKNLEELKNSKPIEKIQEAIREPQKTSEQLGDKVKDITEKATTSVLKFIDNTINFFKKK